MKARRQESILGIPFFLGNENEALDLAFQGGLWVAPSGPNLSDIDHLHAYREAVQHADVAILDSAYLVLLYRWFRGRHLLRLSGLRFFKALLEDKRFADQGPAMWVMPSEREAGINAQWLKEQNLEIPDSHIYIAPLYDPNAMGDEVLLRKIEAERPAFVMLNIGGGVQEVLGYWLRQRLSYRPTIVCTGAAIAFLTGEQADIPPWVDRLYLGWLWRCLFEPSRYIPRYGKAIKLYGVMRRWHRQSVRKIAPDSKSTDLS